MVAFKSQPDIIERKEIQYKFLEKRKVIFFKFLHASIKFKQKTLLIKFNKNLA